MFRNALVGSKGNLSAILAEDQFSGGEEVVDHVANDPNGIGYVTFTQAHGVNSATISDQGTQPRGRGTVQGNNYSLDNLAQDNIQRLSAYIHADPEQQITWLGFTDNQPGRTPDTVLAHDRAVSVAAALAQNGIEVGPDHIYCLGAEMPVATNATPEGKAKNRRVEVWVSDSGS